MKRTRILIVVASALVLSIAGWAQAAPITPVKVIGGGSDQSHPGANGDWIVWTANSPGAPNHWNAFVRSLDGGLPTGQITKLNTGRSQGFSPDLLEGGSEVVWQQAHGSVSNIILADLDVVPLHPVQPVGLNSSQWDHTPMISDSWILFGRYTGSHQGVFLYDRATHAIRPLANPKLNRHGWPDIYPSDVTETYATWTRCVPTACNVYYYDINAQTTHVVANPNKAWFYDPSISDATGDMYFIRSGATCGSNVRIFRWHIGDPATYTIVASLPSGFDAYGKTAVTNDGTHDNLYFNRVRCAGRYYADIYEVPAAETA
jgi:hypothetical protein